MTVLITLTTAGTDSGPFDLYSNLDGYTSAFESGVSRLDLLAGYASALVPDFTTIVRVQSVGDCNNHIDIQLYAISTTSTSTSSTSSTTTTSTTVANTCYEFESDPYTTTFSAQYIDCNGVVQTVNDTCLSPPCTYTLCGFAVLSSSTSMTIVSVCGTTTTTTTSTPTTTTTSSSSSTTTSTTTIVGPTTTTTTTPVTIL
jgi:hypothetical protein